jgi:hypothetical protein
VKKLTLVIPTSPSEHSEQVGFVNWFNVQYPRVSDFCDSKWGKAVNYWGQAFKGGGRC